MVVKKKTEPEVLAISIPEKELDQRSLENLKAIVTTKGSLLKKALGTDSLEILTDEGRISFPWFRFSGEPAQTKAYTHLVNALCDMAKKLKRVNVKEEKAVENEKYAFRCFLLRLGFIGDEYKDERKVLLQNFSGSSAFKYEKRNTEVAE